MYSNKKFQRYTLIIASFPSRFLIHNITLFISMIFVNRYKNESHWIKARIIMRTMTKLLTNVYLQKLVSEVLMRNRDRWVLNHIMNDGTLMTINNDPFCIVNINCVIDTYSASCQLTLIADRG